MVLMLIIVHYLTALGTPLIKGLTEVVHRRPKNPVTYLATYLNNFATHTNGNEYSSPVI